MLTKIGEESAVNQKLWIDGSPLAISVITCARNSERTIEKALKSIVGADCVSEVIVVDGLSSDRTVEIARSFCAKVISDGGRGLGYARQLGADSAKSELVAFVDSDVELSNPQILLEMAKEMLDRGWVAIHACIIDPTLRKTYWQECEDLHTRSSFNKPGLRDSLGTITCIVKRNTVTSHRFDSSFVGASEDADFFYRLSKTGSKFGISTQVIYHYHRQGGSDPIRQRIWYGRGQYRFAKKHRLPIVLASPIAITGHGIVVCILGGRPRRMIPYYLVWGTSLALGIVLGFLSSMRAKAHDS